MEVDPCDICEQALNDGIKDSLDCENCKEPELLPGNRAAYAAYAAMSPFLFDSMGAVNAGVFEIGYEYAGATLENERRELLDKWGVIIETIRRKNE